MIHKNTIMIYLLLSTFKLCLSVNVQPFDTARQTSIFEYGVAIQSVEDNFKNLFQNFPDLIGNNHRIGLLSYEYVGLAGNQRNVRRIVGRSFYRGALAWSTATSITSSISSFIDVLWCRLWFDGMPCAFYACEDRAAGNRYAWIRGLDRELDRCLEAVGAPPVRRP